MEQKRKRVGGQNKRVEEILELIVKAMRDRTFADAEVEMAKKEYRRIEDLIQKYRHELVDVVELKNDYRVYVHTQSREDRSCFSHIPARTEYVTITKGSEFANVSDEIKIRVEAQYPKPLQRVSSVKYFRVGEALVHEGGGHLVLDDYVECTDKDWEDIKAGKLDKFLKRS